MKSFHLDIIRTFKNGSLQYTLTAKEGKNGKAYISIEEAIQIGGVIEPKGCVRILPEHIDELLDELKLLREDIEQHQLKRALQDEELKTGYKPPKKPNWFAIRAKRKRKNK